MTSTATIDAETLQAAARRRMPRFAYDFIAGGAGDERALRRARERLDEVSLLPRVLTGCDDRTGSVEFLGRRMSPPSPSLPPA